MRPLFIIFFFTLSAAGFSQTNTFTIRNYKAVDGLPQSQVNVMLEDKNGYLWIGTEGGGLARFDGRTFQVYTTLDGLLSNIVSFLKLDEQENLWIIHPRGITRFDGLNFKQFQQPGTPGAVRRMRKAFEVNDTLFVLSSPGFLGKIYQDSVYYWSRPLKKDLLVLYSHLTINRDVLMYLSDSSFLYNDGNRQVKFKHSQYFNRVYGMMFNYRGATWLKTDSGYFTVDHRRQHFQRASLPFDATVIHYDSVNDVFWSRNAASIIKIRITPSGVKADTVLREVNVRQIMVDAEGNTWFATAGSGLFKYFIQDFDRCSSDKMGAVMSMYREETGATWIGTMNKGLWRIHHGKISHYSDLMMSSRNAILSIDQSPSGDIYVASYYGLGRYNSSIDQIEWFNRDHGLSNVALTGGLEFDENGNLWIGTNGGGVNLYDGKTFRAFTTADGLQSNTVYAMHYDKANRTLFIGNEFGLGQLKNGNFRSLPVHGFENTNVLSINPYRDSLLLVGSGGAGFAVYDPKTGEHKLFTAHSALPSGFIYFVAADNDDYIWVGSEKGITRLRLNPKLEIIENLHYDHENGLTGVETNQNAFYLSDEKKYFGLIDGLYQFNNHRSKASPFKLHLTDVQVFFGESNVRDFSGAPRGFFKIPSDLRLPPDQNHITFHFNKVDKRYAKSIKFKFYLENFDKTWSRESSIDHVTYGNIPPGRYTLHVVATQTDGSWSSEQLSYSFTVLSPFYKTPAFIISMIVFVAGVIVLLGYIRVKQRVNAVVMRERIRAKEQEALRKEIARDFHDEMGNQLTRIINYVSLLKLNGSIPNGVNGHKAHTDIYSKVEDSAKYLYNGTRDFIWSIDPVNDELGKLFIYIRDFGEKLFEEKSIQFRAFNDIRENVKLPHGFSREANLIFKEAMTNAFKYSNAKNVALTLSRNGESFEMKLQDDGAGFSPEVLKSMNGLKNMRDRAERIKAALVIDSNPGSGTVISINFKLNKTPKYGITI